MSPEELVFTDNDFHSGIQSIREELSKFESTATDPRIKAMVVTKLQEAEMLALLLFKK